MNSKVSYTAIKNLFLSSWNKFGNIRNITLAFDIIHILVQWIRLSARNDHVLHIAFVFIVCFKRAVIHVWNERRLLFVLVA